MNQWTIPPPQKNKIKYNELMYFVSPNPPKGEYIFLYIVFIIALLY